MEKGARLPGFTAESSFELNYQISHYRYMPIIGYADDLGVIPQMKDEFMCGMGIGGLIGGLITGQPGVAFAGAAAMYNFC